MRALRAGSFTLTFDGRTTAPIAYNAAGSAIKTALEALGGFTVAVTGTGTAADPWLITFSSPNVRNAPLLGTDASNLSAPGTAVTTINGGLGADVIHVGTAAPALTGGNVNTIKGPLTVNGNEPSSAVGDLLTIDDTSDATANSAVVTATTVTGVFGTGGSITYGTMEDLLLNLGTGRQYGQHPGDSCRNHDGKYRVGR